MQFWQIYYSTREHKFQPISYANELQVWCFAFTLLEEWNFPGADEWNLPAAVGGQLARAGCERASGAPARTQKSWNWPLLGSTKCTRRIVRWPKLQLLRLLARRCALVAAVHVHPDIHNVMNEHSAGVVLGVARCRLSAWDAACAANDTLANSSALANCNRFFARLLFPLSANISACCVFSFWQTSVHQKVLTAGLFLFSLSPRGWKICTE